MYGKYHHALIHDTYVEVLLFHVPLSWKSENIKNKVLLMMSRLYSYDSTTTLNTLWDPGSDITLVMFDKASRLGLTGTVSHKSQ